MQQGASTSLLLVLRVPTTYPSSCDLRAATLGPLCDGCPFAASVASLASLVPLLRFCAVLGVSISMPAAPPSGAAIFRRGGPKKELFGGRIGDGSVALEDEDRLALQADLQKQLDLITTPKTGCVEQARTHPAPCSLGTAPARQLPCPYTVYKLSVLVHVQEGVVRGSVAT